MNDNAGAEAEAPISNDAYSIKERIYSWLVIGVIFALIALNLIFPAPMPACDGAYLLL